MSVDAVLAGGARAATSSSSAVSSSTAAAASSSSSTAATAPSLPSALGSTTISDEMRTLLDGQRKLHDQILKLQSQIEEEEAAYLEETAHGNIIRGWDGFIDIKQSRKDAALKKVKLYTESEHLFSSCCFYKTLANEPTVELGDYHPRDESSSGRRRAAAASTAAGAGGVSTGTVGRPSSSSTLLKIERKASFSGPGSASTTTPTLGRPPKIKKRKRLDRLEFASTASATQSETGEDDEKDPPPSSLKRGRSAAMGTSDAQEGGGDFMDML